MGALHLFIIVSFAVSCFAEVDLEIIILDDRRYNATKFAEAIADFYPIVIENGTARPLLFSPPMVKITGFINPVICVGVECYDDQNISLSRTSPTPVDTSNSGVVIAGAVVGACIALVLGVLCYWLTKRKPAKLASRFVIRERIDLPPHLNRLASHITVVKTGSKHTRGLV